MTTNLYERTYSETLIGRWRSLLLLDQSLCLKLWKFKWYLVLLSAYWTCAEGRKVNVHTGPFRKARVLLGSVFSGTHTGGWKPGTMSRRPGIAEGPVGMGCRVGEGDWSPGPWNPLWVPVYSISLSMWNVLISSRQNSAFLLDPEWQFQFMVKNYCSNSIIAEIYLLSE